MRSSNGAVTPLLLSPVCLHCLQISRFLQQGRTALSPLRKKICSALLRRRLSPINLPSGPGEQRSLKCWQRCSEIEFWLRLPEGINETRCFCLVSQDTCKRRKKRKKKKKRGMAGGAVKSMKNEAEFYLLQSLGPHSK